MNCMRVLVVDDNRDMVDGIAMLLEEIQLEVQVAYSAEQALALMEVSEFGLVLSDIRMPGMSGVELLKSVRGRWPMTKVVLLTAYGSVDSAVDAMRTGACDYLTKPFDNDELVGVVSRAITAGVPAGGFDVSAVVGEVAAAISADHLLPGLRAVLQVLLNATGADDGEIFLCEPDGGDPLLCVWAGPHGAALAERPRFAVNVGYPGIVAATGRPLVMRGGLADDPRYLRRAVVDAGIRSLAAVPLPDARGVLGSLHLMSRRDDFPVEHVLDLLERAALPLSTAIRAGLAALRQSVDSMCRGLEEGAPGQPQRVLLESMRQFAGAHHGSLAIIDPTTGSPSAVVSTGPVSLICKQAEAGAWAGCPSVSAAHGFVGDPGRRSWPECCRRSLPSRTASPCCLPMITNGRLYGIAVLDFGREGPANATGRLVPLLTMAQQAAVRLEAHHAGFLLDERPSGDIPPTFANLCPELELRCFGPFSVHQRGQEISAAAFTRNKAIVLLKLLALKAGAPSSRDVLIEQLWPDVDPHQGANRLHGVVHALRSVIEPHRKERQWLYVRNRGEVYYLDMNTPISIDVFRYKQLLDRSMRSPGAADIELALLEEAVALYGGDLFEDDPFAEWCEVERQELKERQVNALARLAQLHSAAGADERALDCLRRATRLSPFREELVFTKLELLSRVSGPAEALAAYDDFRRALETELDATPSEQLLVLRRRLQTASQRPASA
ncbi:MAG: response regulator [Myxococcales bacterium]|nr:response regulator [Myxococcales bacterium]